MSNGDLVLGHWKGEGWWYPARVQGEPAAESVPLRYLDGDVETAPVARVRHFTWKAGTRVSCNFQGQGKYYPGTIKNMAGEGVSIHYDDGDREDTTIGRCRSQR